MRSARFSAAALRSVDFRGSHLEGTVLDAQGLRGNVFEPAQLFDVAAVLGLDVRECGD